MVTIVSDLGTMYAATDSDALRGVVEVAIIHAIEARSLGAATDVSAVALNKAVRSAISESHLRDRIRYAAARLVSNSKHD